MELFSFPFFFLIRLKLTFPASSSWKQKKTNKKKLVWTNNQETGLPFHIWWQWNHFNTLTFSASVLCFICTYKYGHSGSKTYSSLSIIKASIRKNKTEVNINSQSFLFGVKMFTFANLYFFNCGGRHCFNWLGYFGYSHR